MFLGGCCFIGIRCLFLIIHKVCVLLTILFSNLTMDETSSALSHGATYYACLLLFSLWMKSFVVTIQMKPTEQYFPVVLFITFCKRVLTFESVDKFLL